MLSMSLSLIRSSGNRYSGPLCATSMGKPEKREVHPAPRLSDALIHRPVVSREPTAKDSLISLSVDKLG